MRISNISQFLNGADNIVAQQHTDGSARFWTINLTTGTAPSTTPVNLTGHTLQFDTIHASGDVSTPDRSGNFTISNFAIDSGASAQSRDALATITDAAQGQISLYLPADLDSREVSVDASTGVNIIYGALRISSSGATPVIRTVRVLIVMRSSVIA